MAALAGALLPRQVLTPYLTPVVYLYPDRLGGRNRPGPAA